jgi:UDP-N-acetylglucosamine--dolichyl-phosphate N-acetylglucosaminephosphotransferase
MEPSTVTFERPLLRPVQEGMKVLSALKLLDIKVDKDGQVVESSNFTLINLWLVWFGPMREDRLALGLTAFQLGCGLLGLLVRHRLAMMVFTADNLVV